MAAVPHTPVSMAALPTPDLVPEPWWEGTLVVFDLETTGVDPETARVVTANVSILKPGRPPVERTWLINPGVEIPEESTGVHGVDNETAQRDGVPAADGTADIIATLRDVTAGGEPLVAYNASYDLTVLDREARRHGVEPFTPGVVVDPFVLDRQYDKWRKGPRTLGAACAHYGVDLNDAHSADADAIAAGELTRALGRKFGLPPYGSVVRAQQVWKAQQARSLEEYFRKTRPDVVVRGEWPVIPFDGDAGTGEAGPVPAGQQSHARPSRGPSGEQPRERRGVPAGGQWKARGRPGPDVALGTDD